MSEKYFLIFIFCICITLNSYCQGCSDAGFCTITSFKDRNDSTTIDKKFHLALGYSYGKGDFNIQIVNPFLELSATIHKKISLNARFYYLHAFGELTTNQGFSDLIFTGSYSLLPSGKIIGGVKIPFTNGNDKLNGIPLPMNYQVSLGTYDIIVGYRHQFKNLSLTLGLQQPLKQNENQFINEVHNFSDTKFQSTNKYKRAGDVMLRAIYSINLYKEKIFILPGLLPIYHLQNDRYTDTTGVSREIKGSQGLTLNGVFSLLWQSSDSQSLEFSFGKPFIARKARPDGLTRHYVAGIEYKIKF